MEEFILSKKELIKLFEEGTLKDKEKIWLYEDKEVKIVALHKVEPRFLQDLTNAEYFKIVFVK
ncbi:hypothetical protein FE243_08285 [Aliarcobacter thereius]|uniref:Uncharacterized protein n=1 Tax=Aliarcobacter thereius TaxID=544718 RepID=A0A5R9H848_9BACT|nr:hypothetical protein FE246_05410 [Aliarcobacter thereius]TLS94872.1 hypothetical protein FE244_00445 [Aliarcobacter thereius]TLT06362.1 hypothetical protein FE243_08285 [Aliarcobacter thereius]